MPVDCRISNFNPLGFICNPSGVRNPRRVTHNVRNITHNIRNITHNIRKVSKNTRNTLLSSCEHIDSIIFWAFPCGSGFAGLRYRFGASTSLTAAPTIPNALRHSNALPQYFFINGGLTPLPIACNNLIFNPSEVRNFRMVTHNVRKIPAFKLSEIQNPRRLTHNVRKISVFNPSGVRNPRRVRYNVRSITYNIRKISKNAQNTFAICRH